MSVPLYHPLNTLKPVAENIWIADGGAIEMRFPLGLKIPFSTRMTLVRLANGSLWCHSPIAPNDALFAEIDALGEVRHLVSPNKIHYAHIGAWKKRYPQACAWASPKVRERAEQQGIAVDFDADLSDTVPNYWAQDLAQLLFSGSRFMQETVFFHRSSKTLILTDLIENFETENMGWLHRTVCRCNGIAAPNGSTPIDFRYTFDKAGKAQAKQCLTRMLAWQPEKIILAHGRWYEQNGTAVLERAFSWLG